MSTITAQLNPLDDWDNLPISHARIGYENLLTSTSGTASDKAITPNTYERWEDASGAMAASFYTGTPSSLDYVGIAAHNLFAAGVTDVLIQVTDTLGTNYTDVESVSITSNDAIMVLFDKVEEIVEVKITVTGGTDREIGVIYAGVALQMYQPIYGGHNPIDLQPVTEYQSNQSESGQFLGRVIIRKGLSTSYQWQHLDPDWYRERFEPFAQSARQYPFFIKWRPDKYDAAAYGESQGDIRPSNMGGGHTLMSVGFKFKAHQDL